MLCIPFLSDPVSAQFSNELKPSTNGKSINLDCRIFGGDYQSKKDYVDVLAISADCTLYDYSKKKFSKIKGKISSIYSIQDASLPNSEGDSTASVFASIDNNVKDSLTGDGGGVIFFKIRRDPVSKAWKPEPIDILTGMNNRKVYFKNVNFKSVGGTVNNKGFGFRGTVDNATHRLLVTEDVTDIRSNKDLTGFSDTSDFTYPLAITYPSNDRSVIKAGTKVKRHQALGWPVEIDGITGDVIGKVHRLGRGVTAITQFREEIYFVYGGNPSILMKYSPTQSINSSLQMDFPVEQFKGQGDGEKTLFAYKQNANGSGGFTIPIGVKVDSVFDADMGMMVPKYSQVFDSLLIAKELALKAGATMFSNVGDITVTTDDVDGNFVLLISEKGIDESGDLYSSKAKIFKGRLANHLRKLDSTGTKVFDNKFKDPYGRVLSLSEAGVVSVFTDGGKSKTGGYFFSNPDKFEVINLVDNSLSLTYTILAVKENVPDITLGRNPGTSSISTKVNEAYFIQIENTFAGALSFDEATPLMNDIAPYAFDKYTLYQTGSAGSNLSLSGGSFSTNSGTFLTNKKAPNGLGYDSYLAVENGFEGTSQSRILAVRNIYPQGTTCLPNPITDLNDNFSSMNSTNLTIWPNPTSGVIHTNEVSNYVVTDVAGQEVSTFSNTNTLDLSNLKKGVYFIKGLSGSHSKIVIE